MKGGYYVVLDIHVPLQFTDSSVYGWLRPGYAEASA